MPENAADPVEHPITSPGRPCGLARRLLVMAYDSVAIIALMMAIIALLLLTPLSRQAALRDPLPTLILLCTWFLYLAWCWRRGGLTLGMRAWRVRLVFTDGATPGWGRCLLRFAVSLISAAALGMGFVRAAFDGERRTWHDLASGAVLVRSEGGSDRAA